MADTPKQEIKLFYCYAREDKILRDELEKHLSWLKRRYQLTNWHDREILPGEEWEQAIDKHLNTAHLILLLISPDFMASDYCYGREMQRALARHKAGTCRVIPILLRPTFWEDAPFSGLQLLPTDARPVTRWPDRDEAFENVTTEINRSIKVILNSRKTQVDWADEGFDLMVFGTLEEALAAFDQAIRLDPFYEYAYILKGNALRGHKRYEEALVVYDQAIRLKPDLNSYLTKGDILIELQRYEEALAVYDQAIRLDPESCTSHNSKGNALYELKRYKEALAAYEEAIRLVPEYSDAYTAKGNALNELKRYEEALAAYEEAIRLAPHYNAPKKALTYYNKGVVLLNLRRYEEALTAYDQAIRLAPNFAPAYNNKGVVLKSLKHKKEAEQAFEKARQLGFESQ